MLSYFNKGWISELIDTIKRPNWEFYFIVDGSASPLFPEIAPLKPKPNTLWVFPPNLEYGFKAGEDGFFRYVLHYMKVPELIENQILKKGYLSIDLKPKDIEHFKELFITAEELYRLPDNTSSLVHEKILLDICIFIVESLKIKSEPNASVSNRERVETIIAWYSSNIKKRYNVKQVAAMNDISTVHLNRLFYECFGKSPLQYFTDYKIQRAKYLMNKTDSTLEEIAKESGFFNDSDLCRTFKKIEKITPSRYRRV